MTNKDFSVAVTKFFYYANNYPCVPITYHTICKGVITRNIPEFFKAFEPMSIEHLYSKFDYWMDEMHHRSGAAMMEFYAELDGSNRARLDKWINENYSFREDYGINLKIAE